MNLLILMAGSSDLFQNTTQKYPKSLIEINERALIDRVIENLSKVIIASKEIIFVIRREDEQKYHLGSIVQLLAPNSKVIEITNDTSGAACTALLATEYFEKDRPLLITNGDQIIDVNYLEVLEKLTDNNLDAGTIVFKSIHPRWSYVRLENNLVIESAEKNPISKLATAGFYWYKKTSLFSRFVKKMIKKEASLEGKYYVCPVFNEMILCQKKIGVVEISPDQYHSFISPEMLANYETYLINTGHDKL
jgi:dTDP-glucose pyrophosphorylase